MAGDSLGNWAGSLGKSILQARAEAENRLARKVAERVIAELKKQAEKDTRK